MTPEPPTQDRHEDIERMLRTGTQKDENTASVFSAIEQNKNRHPFLQLAQCEAKGDLLYYRDKVYVTEFEDLRTKVIRQHHDNPSADHPEGAKTFELVSRHYCWGEVSSDVRQYVSNCCTCERVKAYRNRQQGQLRPLPIPERSRRLISVDFITHLPLSNGFDAVLVIVDRVNEDAPLCPSPYDGQC